MRVLSLFDGMACGYEALQRAGIPIEKYYASEIDKYAIQIAKKNHPDIIEIGDVTEVSYEDNRLYKNRWNTDRGYETLGFGPIDLLIGGSPCQGFSVAGKQLNFEDPRSKLFFEFVRLLKEVKPKYFLLENVKMKKKWQDIISRELGVEPIEINSSLVSAQSRKRLYRTNIPGVTQPKDRGIILKDILEQEVDEKYYLNDEQIAKMKYLKGAKKILRERGDFKYTYSEGAIPFPDIVDRPSRTILTSEGHLTRTSHIIKVANIGNGGQGQRVYSPEGKSVSLSALGGGGGAKTGLYEVEDKIIQLPRGKNQGGVFENKSPTMSSSKWEYNNILEQGSRIRKLTPVECERLQTLPDGYTGGVSDSQRYKMLGNGWTVDVIAHIFRFII